MPSILNPHAGMHVVVSGSFERGFVVYGPFKTGVEAIIWATDHCEQNWEPIPVIEPTV